MTVEGVRDEVAAGIEQPTRSFWLELLAAEVRFRNAGGHLTRSIEAPTGEPVVRLHGVSGHAETWAHRARPGPGLPGSALNLLGQGFTDKSDIDYSVRVLAEHMLAFLDAIGATRAHLVGQSLGDGSPRDSLSTTPTGSPRWSGW